jgi:hypothetical protein
MSEFIKITEADGNEHILNKRYILSAEVNSKGYFTITVGFETNPPYIRHYATEDTIESFQRVLNS